MVVTTVPRRLQAAIRCIRSVDVAWQERAASQLDRLAKPRHSLGRLEEIVVRLCAIQETLTPKAARRRIVVFAADHGVAAEGVSAYPPSVTAEMVGNFLRGGAAINALAGIAGAEVCVVDVGVAGDIDTTGKAASFTSRRVRPGTRNMTDGPAMSDDDLTNAFDVGLDVADAAARDGIAVIGYGEMGIGNTTAASAMTAAFTGASAAAVTGRGTGIDTESLRRKVAVVTHVLRVNEPGGHPLNVLRSVGGLEIAAITAASIGAAAHRIAIVGDGFIATAAAMAAAALCPPFLDYWFAGHLSAEPGHRLQLERLRQEPLLHLGMRLGEGTGAALAMHLLAAAAAAMAGMATFDAAGVTDRQESPAAEAAAT